MSAEKFDPKKLIKYKFKATEALKNVLKAKPQKEAASKVRKRHPVWDYFLLVVYAIIIAFCIRTFLVQIAYIPSDSMEPTYERGNRILINKLAYGIANPIWGISDTKKLFFFFPNPFYGKDIPSSKTRFLVRLKRDPGRMDIIAFRAPARAGEEPKDMVKRIIGLPGEQVKIKKGKVYINGKAIKENHPMIKDASDYGPVKVPYGSYFVLGDNRPTSSDSRYWGPLKGNNIIGLMQMRIWPPKK